VPVLGVVPHLRGRFVAGEDSLDLDDLPPASGAHALDIAVVRLPYIANFDDVDPLAREPGVRVRFVHAADALGEADLVVLPGSKSTIADLGWLRATGLAGALQAAVRRGTPLIGICGGYQMLGEVLHDPAGVESGPGSVAGLGLLPATTTFAPVKRTVRVRARVCGGAGLLAGAAGHEIDAYEIHVGTTSVAGAPRPFVMADGRPEGATSVDGRVLGTYLHGLFADDDLRRALLARLALDSGRDADPRWGARQDAGARYDGLADAIEGALDMAAIARLAGL
jgi:adenosylcobyric acid synthase